MTDDTHPAATTTDDTPAAQPGPAPYRPLPDIIREAVELAELRAEYPDALTLSTGIPEVDTQLDEALTPGQMIFLAGATGAGKTAFTTQLAVAFAHQKPVLHITLEEQVHDVANRQIAQVGRLDVTEVRKGEHVGTAAYDAAIETLLNLDTYSIQSMTGTIEAIGGAVRRWAEAQEEGAGGVVFIDQLSHVLDSNPTDPHAHPHTQMYAPRVGDERQQMEWKARVATQIATALGLTVVLLGQLNDIREGDKPGLTSARGSRGMGQTAAAVLMLNVPKTIQDPFGDKRVPNVGGCGWIEVVKQRRGQEGSVPVQWIGPQQRFASRDAVSTDRYVPPAAPTARQKEGSRKLSELRARFETAEQQRLNGPAEIAA